MNKDFSIYNIYIKDLVYEAPLAPEIFSGDGKPKIDFNIQMASRTLSEPNSLYEFGLHIICTATLPSGKETSPVFHLEIMQAGAFLMKGYSKEERTQLMGKRCTDILFPYARDIISTLTSRGGFPQVIIPFLDFNKMFEEQKIEIVDLDNLPKEEKK